MRWIDLTRVAYADQWAAVEGIVWWSPVTILWRFLPRLRSWLNHLRIAIVHYDRLFFVNPYQSW